MDAGKSFDDAARGLRPPLFFKQKDAIAAQCRSVFDNVRTILEESGSSWNQLVDVTVVDIIMNSS